MEKENLMAEKMQLAKKNLAVIYTERGDFTRIISARRADKCEEEDYYGQFYD